MFWHNHMQPVRSLSVHYTQDGTLTSVVNSCAPSTCTSTSTCSAYQFASVGVTPCALNISQAIGMSITVTFTVFDNGVPPLSATATRTLLIVAPCSTGQYYCSGVCQQISCAASAALAAAAVTPVITLTSIPTAVFGSTSGGSAGVPYGTVPSFSLTPCTSYSDTSSCASVGTDPVYGDISSLVQVTPLQQCEASSSNIDCFNCDVAWLATGSCMPGVYAYQYTLTNSDGYSAVPVNVTVQIYEQGQMVSSIPARKAVGEQVIGRRHMVGFDGNVVVGGLLIHQERRPVLASKRFESLASNSSIQGVELVDDCPVDMPQALCPLKVQPYGQDPVFNPFSSIFDEDLPGLDANYYNITTGSGEVSSVGSPYGWYSQNMQDYSTGFVAIFDVLISTNRSQQILTMLQDGHYLDDQTASLELKLLTFNRQMRVFGVMQMDLQWDYGGTINAQLHIGAIPLIADSASTR
ncbi:hypothetical protein WJX79_005389 [Trebouxia sp. C0005]